MDFEKLLALWANEQGFEGWSQDHAAVLRNLTKWLNIHVVVLLMMCASASHAGNANRWAC